tara:strand:- start:44256 stop:45935 length:1680 start_codon:yes stop_codon:yes gene_type:complete
MMQYHKFKNMKRKIKIILVAISVFLGSLISISFTDNYFEIAKNLDIFTSLYKELNTYYVDETDPGKLMKKGIDAMLKSLDPYTTYIPESEIEDFRFMTTGQYGGIGAIITKRGDYVYINEPYEGFPAQKSGLMAGDKILEINGVSAKGKTTEEVSKILKGQPNTSVTMLIERKNLDTPFDVTFNREKVTVKSIPYTGFIDDGIGYIKLRSFTRNCGSEIKEALKNLKSQQKLDGLVLDLRGNPGGLLNEAVNISNIFIDRGEEIVSTKGKIKEWEKVYKATNRAEDMETPLVVLINQSSASASEIVAGVMQDLDRGIVIGNKSFGKGLVQQSRKLSYNTQLKVTIAKYYIPSGRCIQALDYSNRNDDGSVGEIPDSLKTAFKTKNGRTVYDGGGIEPDINVEQETMSSIIISLIRERLIFDYATEYRFANDSIDEAIDFLFSDKDFEDFERFLSDKEYEYTTQTEEKIRELKRVAEEELYYTEISDEYNELIMKLEEKKKDDLNKFKDEIKAIIASEIVSRYYYQKGRIIANLKYDDDIKAAINILKNNNKYNSILNGI